MSVIALGSVRGAPGVTTTSVLLATAMADEVVVVEGDLSGGVLAARYGLGREPGLTTLTAAGRNASSEWRDHAQLAGEIPVILGPDAPESAHALWRRAGDQIAHTLGSLDATVLVDAGRIGPVVPALAEASLLVLLVRPVAEDLVTLCHRVRSLRQQRADLRIGVLLAGDGPYRAGDVGGQLDVDVLGIVEDDRRAAALLRTGGSARTLARSRLVRCIHGLAPVVTFAAGYYDDAVAVSQ